MAKISLKIKRSRFSSFLIILGLVASSLIIANTLYFNGKGIRLTFNISKSSGIFLQISEYEIYTQIIAIDPLDPSTSVTVLRGFVNNSKVSLDPVKNDKFRMVLDDWIERLGDSKLFKDFETYLLISIWVLTKDNDYRVLPDKVINYNPFVAKRSLIRKTISIKSGELIEVPKNVSKLALKKFLKIGLKQIGGYYTTYEWVVNSTLSRTYSEFIDVPVILLNNPEVISAQVNGEIEIRKAHATRFRLSIGYGYEITENQNVVLDIFSLKAGYKDVLQYKDGYTVGPVSSSKGWIYIKAKPAFIFEEEYQYLWWRDYSGQLHLISVTKTGNQRMRVEIVDVQWVFQNGIKKIVGGFYSGFPDANFVDQFFYGTTIEAPPISDYTIDPTSTNTENSIYLDEVINGYDGSANAIGVGIPVGALIASQIAASSPLAPLIPLIAPFVVSTGYEEGVTARVDGYVQNRALSYSDDNDVSEKVYVAVSEYTYKVSSYDLRVPSGIYFEFISANSGGGGCPYLFTYAEEGFINEGLLNIYSSNNLDVVFNKTLSATPSQIDGFYTFRLVEHNHTYSYIDNVKLFAILTNGSTVELPLVYANHSVYGNVIKYLADSDDIRIIILGSSFRNGEESHFIDLKFMASSELNNVTSFIFQIEGYNSISK